MNNLLVLRSGLGVLLAFVCIIMLFIRHYVAFTCCGGVPLDHVTETLPPSTSCEHVCSLSLIGCAIEQHLSHVITANERSIYCHTMWTN